MRLKLDFTSGGSHGSGRCRSNPKRFISLTMVVVGVAPEVDIMDHDSGEYSPKGGSHGMQWFQV